jgi:hypothetical protein
VSAGGRRAAGSLRAGASKMADFRDSRDLARLVLICPHQGFGVDRRSEMAKFEALAFTIGFIATGLLTVAGQLQLV